MFEEDIDDNDPRPANVKGSAAADPFAELLDLNRSGKKKKKSVSFQSFGFSAALLKGIQRKGYTIPTPIQRKTIPVILEGRDVVAMARTGSGKTAAFLLPILNALQSHKTTIGARAIILSPTRELASQTLAFCTSLGKYLDLRYCLLVGGDSMESQFEKLAANPDIIIATPGRLRHLLVEVKTFSLKEVQFIVFDEGDRLFEMGFADEINEILRHVPPSRQTLVFSATLPALLASFTQAGLNNPVVIRLDTEQQLSEKLEVQFIRVPAQYKAAALIYLLREVLQEGEQAMVFVATRHHVEYLHTLFSQLYTKPVTEAIYGKMDQSARKLALAKFTQKKADVLFVTDLAARGIDIPILDVVINYDFPHKAKLFLHRVGRVARAGRSGRAFSLVDQTETAYLLDLMRFLQRRLVLPPNEPSSPDEIVFGAMPQVLLNSAISDVDGAHNKSPELVVLHRSMVNAAKLYEKTRAPASKESAQEAKTMPNDRLHPLFRSHVDELEVERANFVSQLRQYRPQATIFEFQAREKDPVAKEALAAMLAKRAAHNEIIAQWRQQQAEKPVQVAYPANISRDTEPDNDSKAETSTLTSASKQRGKKSYRDENFYLVHEKADAHIEKELAINEKRGDNVNIEELIFDVVPEDAQEIFKKRTAMQWDRKKKKFVQMSGGVDPNAILRGTIKSESGVAIKKSKVEAGKLYAEWQKKSRKSIGKTGEKEDDDALRIYEEDRQRSRRRWPRPADTGKQEKVVDELKTKEEIIRARKEKERARKRGGHDRNRKRKREETEETTPNKRQKWSGAPTRAKAIVLPKKPRKLK